jgi:hypothetical protein
MYCECALLKPILRQSLPVPKFVDDLIIDEAISLYQNPRNLNETRLRLAMKEAFLDKHPDGPNRPPPETDPEKWYRRFSWINEHGEEEFVRRWIVAEKLKYRGKPDPVMLKLESDLGDVWCGMIYPKTRVF